VEASKDAPHRKRVYIPIGELYTCSSTPTRHLQLVMRSQRLLVTPTSCTTPCMFFPQAADVLTRSRRCLASLSALLPDCHAASTLRRFCGAVTAVTTALALSEDCPRTAHSPLSLLPHKDAVARGNVSNGPLPDRLPTAYGLPTLAPPKKSCHQMTVLAKTLSNARMLSKLSFFFCKRSVLVPFRPTYTHIVDIGSLKVSGKFSDHKNGP
jgi:hypothetical protein